MQRILIIDDERDIVEMFADFFSARGYLVSKAFNGEEGIERFDSDNPDIVMCDIRMPKKDGFEFLKEIRSAKRWVPVIIVSAVSEPSNIMKGYDFEADYYVTKPVDLEKLSKTLQVMLSLAPLRKE